MPGFLRMGKWLQHLVHRLPSFTVLARKTWDMRTLGWCIEALSPGKRHQWGVESHESTRPVPPVQSWTLYKNRALNRPLKNQLPLPFSFLKYCLTFLSVWPTCCLRTTRIPGVGGSQKRALGSLELGLQWMVSHWVGAGNWNWVT